MTKNGMYTKEMYGNDEALVSFTNSGEINVGDFFSDVDAKIGLMRRHGNGGVRRMEFGDDAQVGGVFERAYNDALENTSNLKRCMRSLDEFAILIGEQAKYSPDPKQDELFDIPESVPSAGHYDREFR